MISICFLLFIWYREQPQKPLYTTQAHVFQIDPDTKKSWLPSCKQAVNVSFFYDNTKFIYKVISIENSKVRTHNSEQLDVK